MGQGSSIAVSCGVGYRHGSDPMWLCLWCRPAAAAPIRPLAWGPPYAVGSALKRKRKKKEKKRKKKSKKKRNPWKHTGILIQLCFQRQKESLFGNIGYWYLFQREFEIRCCHLHTHPKHTHTIFPVRSHLLGQISLPVPLPHLLPVVFLQVRYLDNLKLDRCPYIGFLK